MAKIVVALGGNALSKDGKATAADQLAVANETASELIKLITAGHTLAIVHGNGPQIGNIILHEEAINTEKTPTMPVDVAGAMSQGQIGYWLQNALRNQLEQLKIKKPMASIITQVLVSKDDPAFKNPSKPIGPFYTEEEAKKLAKARGFTVKEDAGRGWRRVVPSPKPVEIVEAPIIKALVEAGVLVVSTGGGGIPVLRQEDGTLKGVEAVIDKDFGAATLANLLHADTLLILTSVDAAKVNFNQPNEEALGQISAEEMQKHIDDGQFAAGSMLPKAQAALQFVSGGEGRTAVITSLEKTTEAIDGTAGTRIVS